MGSIRRFQAKLQYGYENDRIWEGDPNFGIKFYFSLILSVAGAIQRFFTQNEGKFGVSGTNYNMGMEMTAFNA